MGGRESKRKLLSMKAIVISRFGGPEGLEYKEVAGPVPGTGQVLVKVEACGVNFADIMAAQGGYPGTPAPPLIAGREFAGVREDTGERVMGYAQWGAFAEQVLSRPELLWNVPQNWSLAEAAAFPVNYFTAYFAYWKAGLLHRANDGTKLHEVRADSAKPPRVLIHAVAGGVGTAAVKIGKILGVEMFGTSSSEEKLTQAKALGLQHGINYQQQDYEDAVRELTDGEGVDAVLEMLGGEHTEKSVRCLCDFGRVIVYGSASGQRSSVDPRILYAKGTSVHGLWLTYLSTKHDLMGAAWKQLSAWATQGELRPSVGYVLPLGKAADAYRLLLERKNFGKVVLQVAG